MHIYMGPLADQRVLKTMFVPVLLRVTLRSRFTSHGMPSGERREPRRGRTSGR